MLLSNPEPSDNLDQLQRQSWQLELIITGFALSAMIAGSGAVVDFTNHWFDLFVTGTRTQRIGAIAISGCKIVYFIVLAHFFLNVVLRCLWIGALAIRHIFPVDDYDFGAYAPRFRNFLRKRHASFDAYVHKLDAGASLIFAFTFMLVIIFLGLLVTGLAMLAVMLTSKLFPESVEKIIFFAIYLVMLFLGIIVMVDFVSGGKVKKKDGPYYYLYRLFGFLLFARLYRPLYYRLVAHPQAKKLLWLIIPYLVIVLVIANQTIDPVYFFNVENAVKLDDRPGEQKQRYYADAENFNLAAARFILPSDVITSRALRVRVPIKGYHGYLLKGACARDNAGGYTLFHGVGGQKFKESVTTSYTLPALIKRAISGPDTTEQAGTIGLETEADAPPSSLLSCLQPYLQVFLDGEPVADENILLRIPSAGGTGIPELVNYFALNSISPGMHQVMMKEYGYNKSDSLLLKNVWLAPFFYAPE